MQPRRASNHVIQAKASEGHAQGPCVAARVAFEQVAFRTEGTKYNAKPPRLHYLRKTKYQKYRVRRRNREKRDKERQRERQRDIEKSIGLCAWAKTKQITLFVIGFNKYAAQVFPATAITKHSLIFLCLNAPKILILR